MLGASEAHWYVVHCKPREDRRALENLERQGFECYWPVREVERRRGNARLLASEALFPRYLFIRLDCLHDNWSAVRSTRGVHEIVRFNTYPSPVHPDIIEAIRTRLAGPVAWRPYFEPGERVQIGEGPFAQLEAIFVANDGDERVVLLLNLMQKDQKLTFPLRSVRKLA